MGSSSIREHLSLSVSLIMGLSLMLLIFVMFNLFETEGIEWDIKDKLAQWELKGSLRFYRRVVCPLSLLLMLLLLMLWGPSPT